MFIFVNRHLPNQIRDILVYECSSDPLDCTVNVITGGQVERNQQRWTNKTVLSIFVLAIFIPICGGCVAAF